MPIEPVKIPQNVYIEDRIVGPLTLRQIITMALGGGISYAIYASLAKAYGHVDIVTTIVVWMPAVIAAAFAVVKINDLSLSRIVLLVIERSLKAPVRTWTPREGISINIKVLARQTNKDAPTHAPVDTSEQTAAQKKIQELSAVVDTAFDEKTTPPPAPARAAQAAPVTIEHEDNTPKTLPVNPKKIRVDAIHEATDGPSVFHDIIPHHA